MKSLFKHLRLLPAVIVIGSGLLAIKGVDIARAAQGGADALDVTGLAPAGITGGTPRPDYASADDGTDSPSEVDVLTSLTHRRLELDARERGLAMRENLLNAGESRVNQKITALQALQNQIQGLLKQRDAAQDQQIASLIKSYGPDGMKPAQAAAIFNTMPDEVLVPIAKGMKPGDLGAIMAKMNPDAAQKLTVKLAALLKLPETAVTAACPVPPAAATPPTTADATMPTDNPPVTLDTPPQQTAAATPPPVMTPAPSPTPVAAAPASVLPATAAAATPPKPHHPAPHHVAHVTPAPVVTPIVTPPTVTPKPVASPAATQAAAMPPKPMPPTPVPALAATTAPKPAAATPVPTQAAALPPKPSATVPAPTQTAAVTIPKPAMPTPPPAPAAVLPQKPSATAPAQAAAVTPGAAPGPASAAPTPLTH